MVEKARRGGFRPARALITPINKEGNNRDRPTHKRFGKFAGGKSRLSPGTAMDEWPTEQDQRRPSSAYVLQHVGRGQGTQKYTAKTNRAACATRNLALAIKPGREGSSVN